MSVQEAYKKITTMFPYLKSIHNPKDFADCIQSEKERNEQNRSKIEEIGF